MSAPTPPDDQRDSNESVCALIVTHNRRELLAECVAAVLGQSRAPEAVLVVDNDSDDGSREMVADRFPGVEVIVLERNVGGAGGFHEGIRLAHARGHAQIWLMDDDTIPDPDALAALLEARRGAGEDAAFIASKVVWTDGSIHPMNRPYLSWRDSDRLLALVESGTPLLPIRATTFVSLLLHRTAIDRFGLPEARYFIWSDDIEYTARITRSASGFIAPRSLATHKTARPHTALTSTGERYYFHVRNTIYMLGSGSWSRMEKMSLALNYARSVLTFLRRERYRWHALGVVAAGIRDGIRPPSDPAGPFIGKR